MSDSLEVSEQPEKRVSQVIVYFGQINPTIKVDETRNYRSTEVLTDMANGNLEGSSALKIIYARPIAAGGRAVANRIATRYLSRYVRAPRQFKFDLLRFSVERAAPGRRLFARRARRFAAVHGRFKTTTGALDRRSDSTNAS